MTPGDCESPILSGVIMNPNIILQVLCVCMFSLGIVGAVLGERALCALGLVAAFGCAMLLMSRDKE